MSARCFPGVELRVETGPIQFGDDWPGVFVRGDDAGAWALVLRQAIEGVEDPLARLQLEGLAETLGSAIVGPAAQLLATRGA